MTSYIPYTQLCGDYFINHDIRIPIKQRGFEGKYPRGTFFVFEMPHTKPQELAARMSRGY